MATSSLIDLEARWPDLAALLHDAGPEQLVTRLAACPDRHERHTCFRFVIRKLGVDPKAATCLDAMIAIGDAAIESALATAERFPEERVKWTDEANCTCGSLASNLADCWSDGVHREMRHFEAGLRFAERALDLRRILGKPAGPFAMAHWAQGKHLLSLHRYGEAVEAFALALRYEESLADQASPGGASHGTATEGMLLAAGFLGLARQRQGDAEGQTVFLAATQSLERKMRESEEARQDAGFYLAQLRAAAALN